MGDPRSVPGLGKSLGQGKGNPIQYSCLENPMDGGAWSATVQGVAKSRTWLSDFTTTTKYRFLVITGKQRYPTSFKSPQCYRHLWERTRELFPVYWIIKLHWWPFCGLRNLFYQWSHPLNLQPFPHYWLYSSREQLLIYSQLSHKIKHSGSLFIHSNIQWAPLLYIYMRITE